jgi:hypothetical protein
MNLHLEMSSMCYMKKAHAFIYFTSRSKWCMWINWFVWEQSWPRWSLLNLGVSFNTTHVMKSLLTFWTSFLRKCVTLESLPKHIEFACLTLVSHYESITTMWCGHCNSVWGTCYKLWYPSWWMEDIIIRNSDRLVCHVFYQCNRR